MQLQIHWGFLQKIIMRTEYSNRYKNDYQRYKFGDKSCYSLQQSRGVDFVSDFFSKNLLNVGFFSFRLMVQQISEKFTLENRILGFLLFLYYVEQTCFRYFQLSPKKWKNHEIQQKVIEGNSTCCFGKWLECISSFEVSKIIS